LFVLSYLYCKVLSRHAPGTARIDPDICDTIVRPSVRTVYSKWLLCTVPQRGYVLFLKEVVMYCSSKRLCTVPQRGCYVLFLKEVMYCSTKRLCTVLQRGCYVLFHKEVVMYCSSKRLYLHMLLLSLLNRCCCYITVSAVQ